MFIIINYKENGNGKFIYTFTCLYTAENFNLPYKYITIMVQRVIQLSNNVACV